MKAILPLLSRIMDDYKTLSLTHSRGFGHPQHSQVILIEKQTPNAVFTWRMGFSLAPDRETTASVERRVSLRFVRLIH